MQLSSFMKCPNTFSRKNKKTILKCRLLKILPRVLSVKCTSFLDHSGGNCFFYVVPEGRRSKHKCPGWCPRFWMLRKYSPSVCGCCGGWGGVEVWGRGIYSLYKHGYGYRCADKGVLFQKLFGAGMCFIIKNLGGIQIYLSGKGFMSIWKGVINFLSLERKYHKWIAVPQLYYSCIW